jgi:hypothetical protein
MSELSNEKRIFARIHLGSEFLLHLKDKEYTGNVSNISLGGLHLRNIQPELPNACIGQQIELFFTEDPERTGIKCEIKHRDDTGIGVSFCQI